jgi:16S rRNA (adenine1518-N6/adenine1519-N6)-dimethyltransferase
MKAHEVLSKQGVGSKKSLGQHFLVDERAVLRILEAAALDEGDTVLEIGPGPGTLTPHLAERAGRVIAVEIDERMLAPLRESLAGCDNVRIVRADILDQDLCQLVGTGPYKVVANLPYYITSAVLRHLLESPCHPHALIVTVQREVAERIVARAYPAKSRPKHATKMSLLAVSVQFYGQPRIVARIPAGAFRPVPAVDSAVVRIDTYAQLPWGVDDVSAFFRTARAGFSERRKQLRNALAHGLALPVENVLAALQDAEIDPRRRAETLSIEEWARLSHAFVRQRADAGD